MIISQLDRAQTQLRLFDRPINGHGAARYVVGHFYEMLTKRMFNGDKHRCSSKATYCPDVSIGGELFLECKAVGPSKSVLVYSGRLDKDWDFSCKHQLFYVVWHHGVKNCSQYTTQEDLQAMLLLETRWCAVVPFDDIWRLCRKYREKTINTQYGISKGSPLYGSGYCIPVHEIEPWKLFDWCIDEEAQHLQMSRRRPSSKDGKVGGVGKKRAAQDVPA